MSEDSARSERFTGRREVPGVRGTVEWADVREGRLP